MGCRGCVWCCGSLDTPCLWRCCSCWNTSHHVFGDVVAVGTPHMWWDPHIHGVGMYVCIPLYVGVHIIHIHYVQHRRIWRVPSTHHIWIITLKMFQNECFGLSTQDITPCGDLPHTTYHHYTSYTMCTGCIKGYRVCVWCSSRWCQHLRSLEDTMSTPWEHLTSGDISGWMWSCGVMES